MASYEFINIASQSVPQVRVNIETKIVRVIIDDNLFVSHPRNMYGEQQNAIKYPIVRYMLIIDTENNDRSTLLRKNTPIPEEINFVLFWQVTPKSMIANVCIVNGTG